MIKKGDEVLVEGKAIKTNLFSRGERKKLIQRWLVDFGTGTIWIDYNKLHQSMKEESKRKVDSSKKEHVEETTIMRSVKDPTE